MKKLLIVLLAFLLFTPLLQAEQQLVQFLNDFELKAEFDGSILTINNTEKVADLNDAAYEVSYILRLIDTYVQRNPKFSIKEIKEFHYMLGKFKLVLTANQLDQIYNGPPTRSGNFNLINQLLLKQYNKQMK
jgi:hypothetical protein